MKTSEAAVSQGEPTWQSLTKLPLSQQLRMALDRLADGARWAHGAANLGDGRRCAWTAQESMDSARFFEAILGFYEPSQVFAWNDAPERTWPEVKAAFEKAIAAAEAHEKGAA